MSVSDSLKFGVAGGSAAMNGWPGVIANLTATAVVFWIVLNQMPQTQDRFHEELAKERQVYREELKELRTTFQQSVQQITTSVTELAQKIEDK